MKSETITPKGCRRCRTQFETIAIEDVSKTILGRCKKCDAYVYSASKEANKTQGFSAYCAVCNKDLFGFEYSEFRD